MLIVCRIKERKIDDGQNYDSYITKNHTKKIQSNLCLKNNF